MMTKRCRSNPVMTCIYGPCYFGGPCHLRDEARREEIRAGEAEYLSWLPVAPVAVEAQAPTLTEEEREHIHQAIDMLGVYEAEERERGNDTYAEGASATRAVLQKLFRFLPSRARGVKGGYSKTFCKSPTDGVSDE